MCVCVCFACSTRGKLPFHLWALTGLPLGLTHACTIHTSSIISFHSILGSIRADIVSVPGTAAHWFCSRSCVGHCCRQDQLPLAACQPVSAAAVATNSCPHSSAWLQSSFSSTLSSLRVITFSLFCPPAATHFSGARGEQLGRVLLPSSGDHHFSCPVPPGLETAWCSLPSALSGCLAIAPLSLSAGSITAAVISLASSPSLGYSHVLVTWTTLSCAALSTAPLAHSRHCGLVTTSLLWQLA